MGKIQAAITAVNAWAPDSRLTNDDLAKTLDTSDEWISSRTGIKERRILTDKNLGTSDMAANAIKGLFAKTKLSADDIDCLICATATPDVVFPSTACAIADKTNIQNAFCFDVMAACSGFLYSLVTAAKYIETGTCKKVLVVGADKMSAILDYADRRTCVLFGDGAGVVLLEPSTEGYGIIDSILKCDGRGRHYLHMKAGGSVKPASHETVENKEHFVYQDGHTVFKYATKNMADVTADVMARNHLTADDIAWLVPHQANKRIIEATAKRVGLDEKKITVNINKYGNTTNASIPLCLWEWEKQLKRDDNLILSAFGAGFTWGSIYMKWGYSTP